MEESWIVVDQLVFVIGTVLDGLGSTSSGDHGYKDVEGWLSQTTQLNLLELEQHREITSPLQGLDSLQGSS
jgi:hypothetical protein